MHQGNDSSDNSDDSDDSADTSDSDIEGEGGHFTCTPSWIMIIGSTSRTWFVHKTQFAKAFCTFISCDGIIYNWRLKLLIQILMMKIRYQILYSKQLHTLYCMDVVNLFIIFMSWFVVFFVLCLKSCRYVFHLTL